MGSGENIAALKIGDYASGTAYATIDSGDVKKGDPVEIADTTGPESLTVTGDVNQHGNATLKMNVYSDDPSYVHSENIPDVLIAVSYTHLTLPTIA